MRDFDQLERRFVHRRLEGLVPIPVAVGFLDDDAALQQQPLEDFGNVEFFIAGVAYAERDVLEIAEQRHVGHVGMIGHGDSLPVMRWQPASLAGAGRLP